MSEEDKCKVYSVYINEFVMEQISEWSWRNRISRSVGIEEAIKFFLKEKLAPLAASPKK